MFEKYDFKLVAFGFYVLNTTFITCDWVNNILRFAMKMSCNGINSVCASASEVIGFN